MVLHFVFIPKYRKPVLPADVAVAMRDLVPKVEEEGSTCGGPGRRHGGARDRDRLPALGSVTSGGIRASVRTSQRGHYAHTSRRIGGEMRYLVRAA